MATQMTESSSSTSTKAAKRKTGGRASRKSTRAASKPDDAIKLLKSDHKEVTKWFDEFERTDDSAEKKELAHKICKALRVHAQIEEEFFYPAAREADIDEDMIDEAAVEHQTAKNLISQIEKIGPDDHLFDATVKVLGEYVKHHVEEEENELFPECREAGMDLKAVGADLAKRKAELMKKA